MLGILWLKCCEKHELVELEVLPTWMLAIFSVYPCHHISSACTDLAALMRPFPSAGCSTALS
jgi:hypothetical protein